MLFCPTFLIIYLSMLYYRCNRRAEPKDTLQHRYQQFQRRMARHYLNQSNAAKEQELAGEPTTAAAEASRKALGKLTAAQASGSITGNRAASSRPSQSQQQSGGLGGGQGHSSGARPGVPANAVGFEIFSASAEASAPGMLSYHILVYSYSSSIVVVL
jgi:hypothetical protein